jgi:hypothetical protein
VTSPSAQDVIREARSLFVGVDVSAGFVGDDIIEGDGDVVLMIRRKGDGERIGVRFPKPELPLQGLALSGVWMRNAPDWIHDLRLVLMEELDTGALLESAVLHHADWTERFITDGAWPQEPDHRVQEWRQGSA